MSWRRRGRQHVKLTRRDALIALGGIGLTATGWLAERGLEDMAISKRDVDTLVALAGPLYPSEVTISRDFVETYAVGQRELEPDHPVAIKNTLRIVRRQAKRRTGSVITELSRQQRGQILRGTGADRAYPDPDGSDAERIRYYIINNLLYALYTTPKGGTLVGNDNPPGYPGGLTAYQEVSDHE